MSQNKIVSCRIHPSIGVARVGNSAAEFFIGPEVPGALPEVDGGFKDEMGAIKRQAARFRVYGYDVAGKVVKELTDDADITWTVRLANKKGAWYKFRNALDIPEALNDNRRRNPKVANRKSLIIDPGPRTISGKNQQGEKYQFTGGTFMGTEVPLGELRTDTDGNLLVLGGRGISATPVPDNPITDLNNDGWYDDVSDGPVTAQVQLKNGSHDVLNAEPAWVLVGPPNYAPGLTPLVTLYDAAYEAALQAKWLKRPKEPSFTRHIYPIFERICATQWVNQGFFLSNGWKSPDNFLDPGVLARLSSKDAQHKPLRESIFKTFRNPQFIKQEKTAFPSVFGDGIDQDTSTRYWLAITPTQYAFLKQWAAGNFKDDWSATGGAIARPLREYPLQEQPSLLDQSALDGCTGGPFHPGIEATWPLRVTSMYVAPFRLNVKASPDSPPDDYGPVLTKAMALAAGGPLSASGPGDLTRWMAVPWQADLASCGAILTDPYQPTWWPASVPNHVITDRIYRQIMDPSMPSQERLRFFNTRENWLRNVALDWADRINDIIEKWQRIGIVVRRPAPQDSQAPPLPQELYVETGSDFIEPDLPMDELEKEIEDSMPVVPVYRHPQFS